MILLSFLLGVVIFVAVIVFVIAAVRRLKNKTLFMPTKHIVYKPHGVVTNFYIDVEKEKIHCQYIINTHPTPIKDGKCLTSNCEVDHKSENVGLRRDVVVYFHGTNNNLSCRKYVVDMSKMIGSDLLLIDYAGYGLSSGKPSLENMEKCGPAAIDFLYNQGYEPGNIKVWAESIGSIAGSSVACSRKVHSIVVLFGVASFQKILINMSSSMKQPLEWFCDQIVPDETNEDRYKRTINKLIFLHSPVDNVIPFKSVENMVNDLKTPLNKGLIVIDGKHSCPSISTDQMLRVLEFMDVTYPCMSSLEEWVKTLSCISNGIEFRVMDY